MINELRTAFLLAQQMWAKSVNLNGSLNPLTEVLGKAAELLRDATLIADRPGLKQTHCVMFGGEWHQVIQRNGEASCHSLPELSESLLAAFRVPTCEKCVEIMLDESKAKASNA